jgi:mRNA-degrading endonuclease RelE of RelBE toxin-antitoxin system
MSRYHGTMIRFTRIAKRELDDLPRSIQARMEDLIDRLEKWPAVSGAKPLRGNLAGHYRLRTGDFRLQFRVVGQDIIIEHIGHRARFYD